MEIFVFFKGKNRWDIFEFLGGFLVFLGGKMLEHFCIF